MAAKAKAAAVKAMEREAPKPTEPTQFRLWRLDGTVYVGFLQTLTLVIRTWRFFANLVASMFAIFKKVYEFIVGWIDFVRSKRRELNEYLNAFLPHKLFAIIDLIGLILEFAGHVRQTVPYIFRLTYRTLIFIDNLVLTWNASIDFIKDIPQIVFTSIQSTQRDLGNLIRAKYLHLITSLASIPTKFIRLLDSITRRSVDFAEARLPELANLIKPIISKVVANIKAKVRFVQSAIPTESVSFIQAWATERRAVIEEAAALVIAELQRHAAGFFAGVFYTISLFFIQIPDLTPFERLKEALRTWNLLFTLLSSFPWIRQQNRAYPSSLDLPPRNQGTQARAEQEGETRSPNPIELTAPAFATKRVPSRRASFAL